MLAVLLSIPTAATALLSFGHQLPYVLERLWQGFLGFFGVNRKKRPWGRVINAATGEALPYVAIRIIDIHNNRSTTEISGPDGSFQTYLPSGEYSVLVSKLGWVFEPKPSLLTTVVGEQLYTGKPITLHDERVVSIVIPMREQEPKRENGIISWRLLAQKIESVLSRLSWPLILFGFGLNTLIMLDDLTFLNGVIELSYIAIMALKIAIQLHYRAAIGQIMDAATNKPVSLAAIRLYNAESGRMVTTKVTTAQGKFFLLASPGIYTAQVAKDGYNTYRESHIAVKSRQSQALAMSIKLIPIMKSDFGSLHIAQ